MLCPKDLKPCMDDLCRGGGGCFYTGEALYRKCECGAYVSDEDDMDCTCEPDYEEYYGSSQGTYRQDQ